MSGRCGGGRCWRGEWVIPVLCIMRGRRAGEEVEWVGGARLMVGV